MEKLLYIQTEQDTGKELENYIDQDGERLSTFGPISRVNILVGATNSGKSRFMRGLVRSSSYVGLSLDPSIASPSSVLNICGRLSRKKFHILIEVNREGHEYDPEALAKEFPGLAPYLKPAKQGKAPELPWSLTQRDFSKIKGLLMQEYTKTVGGTDAGRRRDQLNDLVRVHRLVLGISDLGTADRDYWFNVQKEGLTEHDIENIETILKFIEALPSPPPLAHKLTPPMVVYIPVLRTAVRLQDISTSNTTDSLSQSILTNYEIDPSSGKVEVFTGNLLYWTIQKERSSELKLHKRLKDFEQFLGKTFFEGKSAELKPLDVQYVPGRHLALLINEEIQRPFHDIGDGIQAIIILMYRLFTADPGTWIFIEEPEQGLHPGLQRVFLETLARHPRLQDNNLKIFMSTHSNHLLGMAISELEDVSVFAFQRRTGWTDPERFEVRLVHSRQQSLLTLLGVANSSVFLANCGIWVEGITDRKYLRAYLSAYLKSDEFKAEHSFEPQEDVHYAFFEYAGSNSVHYLFGLENGAPLDQVEQVRAQFLCNRIFLLADRDEGKEEKHKHLEASQSDSFTYYVTPGIEVENLLSEAELLQALPQLISGLTEEDVARAKIQFSDYRNEHLGHYLKEKLGDSCPDALEAASGTLSAYYKDKLASLVCPHVSWETMSKDSRKLAKALYEFIHKHNQIASTS
jgi:hypothetical protein